jgi:hypothetical protein
LAIAHNTHCSTTKKSIYQLSLVLLDRMTSNFTVLDFSVEITLDPMPRWQQIQEDKEIMTKRSSGTATKEDHVFEKEKEEYGDPQQHDVSTSSSSQTMNQHEEDTQSSSPCVVGTITLLPNAIMVWIGWGTRQDHHEPPQPQRQRQEEEEERDGALKKSKNIGTGMPVMGPLVVAMPQRHYKGAFGTSSRAMRTEFSSSSSPSSQLIGGDQELEVMLGNSMAMRLAQKVGKPVYVSCSLSSHAVVGNTAPSSTTCTATSDDNGMTINSIMTQQGSLDVDMEKSALVTHAAALAERKIARLLLERLQK